MSTPTSATRRPPAEGSTPRPLAARWTRRLLAAGLPVLATAVLLACGAGDDEAPPPAALATVEARQGGMGTAFESATDAFATASRIINVEERRIFANGNLVFEGRFTPDGEPDPDTPEGVRTMPGLGPRFDATGCTSCHVNDGRSITPTDDGPVPDSMVVKLETDDADTLAAYGTQLQRHTTDGTQPEVRVTVRWEEVDGTYGDGTPYSLRRPVYSVEDPAAGPIPDDAVLSVRAAPPLIGLGLLELIPVDDLQDRADPDDRNGDGISGRLGVAHVPFLDTPVVGRFGWQASSATVEHQVALALLGDIGVTTSWFPADACQAGPTDCPPATGPVRQDYVPNGEPVPPPPAQAEELSDRSLFDLTVYTEALAVPAVRDVDDPRVRRGAALFEEVGCTACHAGGFTTDVGSMQGLSGQLIDPGTDLLLYDMGDGLADRTLAGDVVPTEWRAAPLWGLGLAEVVAAAPTGYLHDGRARTIAEAVLWHGGEAEPARERFRTLPADERDALLAYLTAR